MLVPGSSSLSAQAGAAGQGIPEPVDPLSLPRPSLAALRVTEPIRLDGILDEPAWMRADSTPHRWMASQPRDGLPLSEPTVARVLYDDENLYVGALVFDSQMDRLSVPGLEQDFATQDSDFFGIVLDTFHDRQNAYLLAVNPQGAVFDAQAFNDQQSLDTSWEGVVHAATALHEWGWSVEMAIPFTTLRFLPIDGEQIWGLNFSRRIRRRNEDGQWAALPRQFRVYRMSLAGTLTGLRDLPRGRNLGIKPFVVTGGLGTRPEGAGGLDYDRDLDVGIDAKWGVTPQMALDLTVNTDFSQVEVDQEQVNLTRFSLFFPEKRDFFLENAGIFAFGDTQVRNFRMGSSPRSFTLFQSRQIGLSATREPISIVGGARLTGRTGEVEIGMLNMQTRRSDEAPADNFSVVRLRRNVLASSDVGAMFIARQPTTDGFRAEGSYTAGTDANLRVLGNMLVNAYLAGTWNPDDRGDRAAGMVQVAWRDPVWDASVLLKHVGDGFDPSVGFVDRSGVRRLWATVGAHPQPALPPILEINPYFDVDLYSGLDWSLETRLLRGGLLFTFEDGGTLRFENTDTYERLPEPAPIAGALVPEGEYDFTRRSVRYTSSGERAVSGDVSYGWGDFFDGERRSASASLQLRPSYRVAIDLSAQRNDLRLGGTAFDADLYRARLRYSQSTQLFLSGFVQYNQATGVLVTNARFNWLHAPLSDVFLVFAERRDTRRGLVLDRRISLKVTKLLSF